MTMKTVCAWCLKHLKGPEDAELTSHGMCDSCFANAAAQLGLGTDPEPEYNGSDEVYDLGGEG